MPIKASYCDAFYEACKDDYFCSCLPEDGCSNPLAFFSVANIDDCSAESGRCKTFADTFADAKEVGATGRRPCMTFFSSVVMHWRALRRRLRGAATAAAVCFAAPRLLVVLLLVFDY